MFESFGAETIMVLKLVLACLFGGVIGYLREKDKKAAGLRTHILVCLGATLLIAISIFVEEKYIGVDISRIASNIIVGIGFIGAGTIIQQREGFVVGITTAASIWVTAAMGMALGFGMYLAATATLVLAIVTLKYLGFIEKKFLG